MTYKVTCCVLKYCSTCASSFLLILVDNWIPSLYFCSIVEFLYSLAMPMIDSLIWKLKLILFIIFGSKVKVLFFSDTGMRATPFMRQLARNYQDYASFACVLWREEEYTYWSSMYAFFSLYTNSRPVVHSSI